jgi:hypothetical protein
MQIMPTSEQMSLIREYVEPFIIPVLAWMYKRLKTKLNGMITENANRIRDELKTYLDEALKAHEINDNKRFDRLELLLGK